MVSQGEGEKQGMSRVSWIIFLAFLRSLSVQTGAVWSRLFSLMSSATVAGFSFLCSTAGKPHCATISKDRLYRCFEEVHKKGAGEVNLL